MKLVKLLGATIVSVCAFAGPALAGQGFLVTFDSAESQFPTTTIGNINYRDWYQNGISAGQSVAGGTSQTLYTEHCASFFGCGSNKGDQSLAKDGILWSLMVGSSTIVNFCLSNNGPISTTCGVVGSGGSQLTYDNWIAGCYVPGGGYTCTVTGISPSGDQIAITYTLGLPPDGKVPAEYQGGTYSRRSGRRIRFQPTTEVLDIHKPTVEKVDRGVADSATQ